MKITPPPGLIHALAVGLTQTLRFHHFGLDRVRQAARVSPTGTAVFCLWHQSLLTVIGPHRRFRIAALASRSSDGEIIADHLRRLGLRAIRGSSARGAVPAARELIAAAQEGWMLAIAVDGPRGPFKQPKIGPIELARRYGLPLVPVAARATREISFRRSWDRFRVPLPRAQVAVVYGEPIWYPSDEPNPQCSEERRRALARTLHDLEAEAARRCGRRDCYPSRDDLAWLATPLPAQGSA